MGKQIFLRVKKALAILLLISLAVSLTATSVSAGSSSGNTAATQEKSACETSMMEAKATSERSTCAAQSALMATQERGAVARSGISCDLNCIFSKCPECQSYILTGNTAGAIVCAQISLNRSCNACCQYTPASNILQSGLFFGVQELEDCANGLHNIQKSETGTHVKKIQQALIFLQYSLPSGADGVFGPQTEAAVKQFQSDHSLTADGIVGPNTIKKLDSLLPSANP